MIAHLLVTEGFTSVEEVAYVPIEELSSIEGFDEGIAAELQRRAQAFLETVSARAIEKAREHGAQDDLIDFEPLTSAMVEALAERGVKSLEDFADLASDELIDREEGLLREVGLSPAEANDLIMKARVAAGWFTEEELAAAAAEAESDETEEESDAAASTV